MTTRRIYVASSWRNPDQPAMVSALRARGHEVYDFRNPSSGGPACERTSGFGWRQVDPTWEANGARALERYREMLRHPIARAGFAADFNAMQWADTCVLVMPSGRSAHIEAGWMAGQGKKLIVYHPPPELWNFEPELMYLVGGDAREVIAIGLDDVHAALDASAPAPDGYEEIARELEAHAARVRELAQGEDQAPRLDDHLDEVWDVAHEIELTAERLDAIAHRLDRGRS